MTAGTVVLKCTGVTAQYGPIAVVHDASLMLRRGTLSVILGLNGAGKSSLLGSLAGCVRGRGKIALNGVEIGSMSAHRRASAGLSFVPERRGNIFAMLSVRENVDMGLRLLGRADRAVQQEQAYSLFPVLRDKRTSAAGMLSGGEQQMLAIAMALGRRPSVLLLDEPTQGLAPTVFDVLESTFAALKGMGLAVLVAEQNVPFSERIADEYLLLSRGAIVRSGSGKDLSDSEMIEAAMFGARD